MKKCTDKMRNADESNLMAGDKVLLRQLQPRANKWTVQFGTQRYALIDKCGSSVVVELRGRGNLEIQYTLICIIKETNGQERASSYKPCGFLRSPRHIFV